MNKDNVKPSLLIVEDNKIDRMAMLRKMKHLFSAFDYKICTSVKETIDVLNIDTFDIIITDFELGDGTAFDFLDLVVDTPVIFVTGRGDEELAVDAMKNKVYDYLIKDSTHNYLNKLPAVVEKAISNSNVKRKLAETQRRYKMLVESANDIIYKADLKGRIVFVNEVAERVIGYHQDELLGKRFIELLLPEYKKSALEFYKSQNNKRKQSTYYELQIDTKDGKRIWFGQNITELVSENGELEGYLGVMRDITKQVEDNEKIIEQKKQLEEQNGKILGQSMSLQEAYEEVRMTNENLENLVKERTKNIKHKNDKLIEFARMNAHDVRGPLARILGLIYLMKSTNKNEIDKIVTMIDDSANELNKVVHGMTKTLEDE